MGIAFLTGDTKKIPSRDYQDRRPDIRISLYIQNVHGSSQPPGTKKDISKHTLTLQKERGYVTARSRLFT